MLSDKVKFLWNFVNTSITQIDVRYPAALYKIRCGLGTLSRMNRKDIG